MVYKLSLFCKLSFLGTDYNRNYILLRCKMFRKHKIIKKVMVGKNDI